MPPVLPSMLGLFIAEVVPILQRRGLTVASDNPRSGHLYPNLSRPVSYGAMSDGLEELVRSAIRTECDDLRKFVDRRIAELSMEIHATVQLVDYSETNLSQKLASIHEQIANMVAAPIATTYNSGVELEAVVQATENAANQIMGAAEAIGTWLQAGSDPASLSAVTEQVNTIFEACTFQDLTGQRIRRAIEHLQQVETMITGMIHEEAPAPQIQQVALANLPHANPDLVQTDIDSMFG
jgi:chemotaxis protein CheZ